MSRHDSRSRHANVVATFDSQLDASEAILELRLAGFRDDQIGYYTHSPDGELDDLLERNYWITGAALGAIAGFALGAGLARLIPSWASDYVRGIDPLGLLITCAVFGMLFVGWLGGLVGTAIHRRRVLAPTVAPTDGPLVVVVRAGDQRDRALEMLRRRGGHVTATEPPPSHVGTVPAVHPA